MQKGNSYPIELRERVLRIRKELRLTYEEAGKLFEIGPATVNRWARLAREQGNLKPKKRHTGPAFLLNDAQREGLRQLVEEKPDRTIAELVQAYAERFSLKLSASSMGRYLRRLGLTIKKKSSTQFSANVMMSKNGAKLT